MGTKQEALGALDKDILNKIKAKWDQKKADEAEAWIESVTGKQFKVANNWVESLKDGELLCALVNAIQAGSAKYTASKQPFVQRENISNFLTACKRLGVPDGDVFVTGDLYEGDNLPVVVDTIHLLGAASRKCAAFEGPYIGVKLAEENKREHSDEQRIAGAMAVPFVSAGSVAVAKEGKVDNIVKYGMVDNPISIEQLRVSGADAPLASAGSVAVKKKAKWIKLLNMDPQVNQYRKINFVLVVFQWQIKVHLQ